MRWKVKDDPTLPEVLHEYYELRHQPSMVPDANARIHGNSVLNVAAMRGSFRHVKVLVENGANVNFVGEMDFTPLHDAVTYGHIEVVEYLLVRGANRNVRNAFGKTPLEISVDHGFRKISALLRKKQRK